MSTSPTPAPTPAPAATAVETGLFRALAVLRLILAANAVGLNVYRAGNFVHPVAGAACVGVLVVWTAFATWAYAEPRRRSAPLLAADLVVALGLLAATPMVKGAHFNASVPGFWVAAALLAWAAHLRTRGGLVAGLLLAGVDLSLRDHVRQLDYGNGFLLVVGGAVVGYLCGSLQLLATERDAAERAAAAAAERARLARAVHDGVLQVLALVQRRGGELAGELAPGPGRELAELARLAGEQERELRRLVRTGQNPPATASSVDLAGELTRLEADGPVTVSTPGFPVELAAPAARELLAATRACLDNVRAHVGAEAPAWVLLEAHADRVEVSVRDDGPGIAPGRLEAAAAGGRLGVRESIRGRLAELGGSARLTTGSFGTEWLLTVPLGTGRADGEER